MSIQEKLNIFKLKINSNDIKIYSKELGWFEPISTIKAIQELNINIINDIVDGQYENISKVIGPDNDKIEYAFFDVMIYRHCLVFIVLQYSYNTQKVRFVAYGTDVKLHSSQGTNLIVVSENDIIKFIEERIKTNIVNNTKIAFNIKALDKIIKKDYQFFI